MATINTNKIRIKDIAEKAKVSIGTVDRVIHNRGEVSEDTKKKVLKIVKELNYKPNILARSLANKREYIAGILVPGASSSNPYWRRPIEGIMYGGEMVKDYNIVLQPFFYDIDDEMSFKQKSMEMLGAGVEGVILAPYFYESALEFISLCNENDIPYIFIDSNIENQDNLSFYGQDAFQSGKVAARLLSYGMGEDQPVLVLNVVKQGGNINHLLRREEGFYSFFQTEKHLLSKNIISVSLKTNNERAFNEELSAIFDRYQNLGCVFVTNSKVYRVASFMQKNNINNVRLLGYDLIDDNMYYLNLGIIDFLIGQKPGEQGYQAVMALFDHIVQDREVQKMNYSNIDIITKENLAYYMNQIARF